MQVVLGGHAVLSPLCWFCCWLGGLEGHLPCREGWCSARAAHARSSSDPCFAKHQGKGCSRCSREGRCTVEPVLVGSVLFSDPLTPQRLCMLPSRGVACCCIIWSCGSCALL